MGVVALEHDRLDRRCDTAGIGDADDPGAREQGRVVGRLAALLDAVAGHDHGRRRRGARDLGQVAVTPQYHDVGAAHVVAHIRDARKLLCTLYTFTDYTYLFTHEFSGREEK